MGELCVGVVGSGGKMAMWVCEGGGMESRSAQLIFGACVSGPPVTLVPLVFAVSDAWVGELSFSSWPLGAGSFPSCLGVFAWGQLCDVDLTCPWTCPWICLWICFFSSEIVGVIVLILR